MSQYALALATGLASLAALLALALMALRQRLRSLSAEREERRAALANTSRLLIDKNMELFDQNVKQQEEIARKEDFIEILSHQLRTPATEVRWGLDALGAEMKRNKREGLELEYYTKLAHSADRMVKLIDNLVHLMSIDEQELRPTAEPYDPGTIVREAAQEAAGRFAAKRITLSVTSGFEGQIDSIDPDSLSLVAQNLVENAFEYTGAGGKVSVASERAADGSLDLLVADTGVGIPESRRATMFVKFERGEAARKMNSGGMGLGLYLVKNIVERNGGSISFESPGEGRGTTFRVTLPAKRAVS